MTLQRRTKTHKDVDIMDVDFSRCPDCRGKYKSPKHLHRHLRTCNERILNRIDRSLTTLIANLQPFVQPFVQPSMQQIQTHVNPKPEETPRPTPNTFGAEHTDYVVADTAFMTDCVNKREVGLCRLVQRIHFSKKAPWNHNVRYDFQHKLLQIHDGIQWKYFAKNRTLKELLINAAGLYVDHFDATGDDAYPEYMIDYIRAFYAQLKDDVFSPELLEEAEIAIINGSARIFGT